MTSGDYNHIFKEMSFEMLKDILSLSESPKKAVPVLLGQIRELTGAKIITIFKCPESGYNDKTKCHEMIETNPIRKKDLIPLKLYQDLIKIVHNSKKITLISDDENVEQFQNLQKYEVGLSLLLPINMDGKLLGSFILLGLPTKANLNLIIQGLDILLGIFALTFRSSLFYMDMEKRVEARTKLLQESETRLKNAQHLAKIGDWELDHKTKKILWSNEIFRIFELDEETFIPSFEKFLDIIHPEDRDFFDNAFKKSLKKHNNYSIDHRLLMNSGEVKYVHGQCVNTYDTNGNPIKSIGTVHDVTSRKLNEIALQESEKKYKNILQTSNDGFWYVDMIGRFLDINEAYCKMSGYTRDELLSMSIQDVESNENEDEIKTHINKIMKNGSDRFETIHQRKDGSNFNVEVSTSLLESEGSEFFVAFIRDITTRKKHENALRILSTDFANLSGKRFYEAVSKHIAENFDLDYVFIGELSESKKLVNVIGGFAEGNFMGDMNYELLDTPCKNVMGQNVCYYPENVQKLFPKDELLIQMGIDGYIGSPLFKKNGEPLGIIVGLSKTPLKNIQQINQIYSIFIDRVTSEILREKANIDLRESELRFKALHNASFGGIAIHTKGLILECNAGLSEITGYSIDELIGMNGLLLISEETRENVISNINSGYEKVYEAIGIRKNGSRYPLRLEARNIPYKGKEVRVVEFRDISEIKEADIERRKLEYQLQQAHKLEAIGTLTGGIAHDFNNMLTPIMGYADMMKYKLPKESQYYHYVVEILAASLKAKDLINQLMTFSRKDENILASLNIIPVLKNSLKLMRSSIPASIKINMDIPQEVDNIFANSTQIYQIIMNLCINSSHAMERKDGSVDGEIDITLKEIHLDKASSQQFIKLNPGKYLHLSIKDDGVGMDKETVSHIFEPFFTTKEEGRGTGMGLAVVHGIISNFNGEIKVYSTPEKGTNFNIYIPVTKMSIAKEKEIQKINQKVREEKLLILDDRSDVTKLIDNMLSPFGFDITVSNDSRETLEFLTINPNEYDLLITDLTMPGLSGLELAKELRNKGTKIPIILLTGHGFNLNKIEKEKAKIDAMIHKPILLEELLSEIEKIFE